MKDVIKVSTVAFNAKWGEKERNLNRMTGYIEAAASEGSNIIAVSYTHLDVYKRQVHPFPGKIVIRELIPFIIRPENLLCYQVFYTRCV